MTPGPRNGCEPTRASPPERAPQRNHVIFGTRRRADTYRCLCSVFKEPVPASGRDANPASVPSRSQGKNERELDSPDSTTVPSGETTPRTRFRVQTAGRAGNPGKIGLAKRQGKGSYSLPSLSSRAKPKKRHRGSRNPGGSERPIGAEVRATSFPSWTRASCAKARVDRASRIQNVSDDSNVSTMGTPRPRRSEVLPPQFPIQRKLNSS